MEAIAAVFVAEGEYLSGQELGVLGGCGGSVGQQPDLGEADLQQLRPEPVFPGPQDGGDGQRIVKLVGAWQADQRQHIGGSAGGDEPDPGGWQRAEDLLALSVAQVLVL